MSSWRLFFQKVVMIWKVTINFYDSVNYEFRLVFHAANRHNELWSRRHCIKSVTVRLLWPVMLHQRLQLKKKKKTKKKLQAQKHSKRCPSPSWASTARNLWRNYVGDFRLVKSGTCSNGGTGQRAKETRYVSLAPNRGSLGVLWTCSGSVVVLSWDLTHKWWKHADKHTDTRIARHKQRGSTRPRIKHTPLRIAQRHLTSKTDL